MDLPHHDQESLEFWSTLLQALSDSNPKYDLSPESSSPILVMSTSVAINIQSEPSNALGDGDKPGSGKAAAELGDKNINKGGQRSTGKQIEKAMEEGVKEEMKNLGKRPRKEARRIVDKRRRTGKKNKMEILKQLMPNCIKGDLSTTLDFIIHNIRWMKLYVEGMGPMLSFGINMDLPAPWFPFTHPKFMMPPNFMMLHPLPSSNGYIQEESSGCDEQIVPVYYQGNQQSPATNE